MEKKLSGNAFPECFEQETHVRHIVHDDLRGTSTVRINITHCGSEEHVVQRRGQLLGEHTRKSFSISFILQQVFMAQSSFPLSCSSVKREKCWSLSCCLRNTRRRFSNRA